MPTNCARRKWGDLRCATQSLDLLHDPTERARCEKFDIASGSRTAGAVVDDITNGRLPTFGLLIPDVCHDGHDC
jgi:phosphatidylinositol-3-phosphatase